MIAGNVGSSNEFLHNSIIFLSICLLYFTHYWIFFNFFMCFFFLFSFKYEIELLISFPCTHLTTLFTRRDRRKCCGYGWGKFMRLQKLWIYDSHNVPFISTSRSLFLFPMSHAHGHELAAQCEWNKFCCFVFEKQTLSNEPTQPGQTGLGNSK